MKSSAYICIILCGVAPLVGAWIEILSSCDTVSASLVAPLVGAWIEIFQAARGKAEGSNVAPLVGAWIEIIYLYHNSRQLGTVAPLVGAWIEMDRRFWTTQGNVSLLL